MNLNKLGRIVESAGLVVAIAAILDVGLRAALRLEMRWDTFWYHIPFAARRVGMGIPYTFPPGVESVYQGFPPLADFLQGLLWRLTGSVNGTGVLNFLGLGLFFFFCWRYLTARFWICAVLSLTVPLVLIHAASSYIDLFCNAMLAIGVSGFLRMLLQRRWRDRQLLLWALSGAVVAAWSKYQAVPTVAVLLIAFLIVYCRHASNLDSRRMAGWVLAASLLAAAPYVKNLVVYHNPFWPMSAPVLKDHFPFALDMNSYLDLSIPTELEDRGHTELFLRSVFEIDHPTSYPNRERWIIDQGNAGIAFRSGGFWNVAVITASLAACLLGFVSDRRHGWITVCSLLFLWVFVSQLPRSHELRYYLFLPLTIAALVAMFVPVAREKHPALTLIVLLIVMGEFGYVSIINRFYYRIERAGLASASNLAEADVFWTRMEKGKTYCLAGFEPFGVLFTGPTLHEFTIVDVPDIKLCPKVDGIFVRNNHR